MIAIDAVENLLSDRRAVDEPESREGVQQPVSEETHSHCKCAWCNDPARFLTSSVLGFKVSIGQLLTLRNSKTGEEVACRVVYVSHHESEKRQVGVEFMKSALDFGASPSST